jgi:hypothetical protein
MTMIILFVLFFAALFLFASIKDIIDAKKQNNAGLIVESLGFFLMFLLCAVYLYEQYY